MKTEARTKAEKYVLATGSFEKALSEINKTIASLESTYPTGYDYQSSNGYKSVTAIRTEIEKLKYINCKP